MTRNKLKDLNNQELLAELRERIIAGTIEVDWEDTYGDSATITNLSTYIKGKKWFCLNFEEALTELDKKAKKLCPKARNSKTKLKKNYQP